MLRNLLVFAAATAIGITAVAAQTEVVAKRKQLMKENGKHAYGELNRMVRGQMPYDQVKVDAAFAQFTDTMTQLPNLFPAGSYQGPVEGDDYYASQKAFDNQVDIKARADKFLKEIADKKDQVKDLASLKSIWPSMNENDCDSCHEVYRVKKG
jgi:cytochrome c556